jgi:hypothetical protein
LQALRKHSLLDIWLKIITLKQKAGYGTTKQEEKRQEKDKPMDIE